ncbi:MAG: PSD1 and planctomycete cytochrome C domain-containing protein [Imperialibacter sp.]|uniref:PSD1 and planctomycete cytochrome C domain-containing protein n=1 Tax=Imperialibacter sp. TaxID=2038411 RepID=UPI003A8C75BC
MYTRLITGLLSIAFAGLILSMPGCKDSTSSGGLPETVSYNFHIRPLMSDRCFACHGPDKNKVKAGLRLDIPELAFAELKESKGKFAIVPGKPEESELVKRISSADPAYQMPSPESHLPLLTENEIELVKKWIKQGAKFEKLWSFIPPKKAPLPKVKNDEWPKNDLDLFVVKKMEEKGLKPNEGADKERLLKRVALDLTGLPPSLDLMDRFMADDSDNAYEKVVDELINTPAYGERMAVHWLDVGRYSDSYGYQDDNIRTQWPWRDWVIHAFNNNLPYDKFLTWQLAGDMLPDADKEKILATGFLRNHKYTEEGGVIDEEYRVEYILDKTKTFSKGILGLTVECAQCHDHKYDPISQKDYFRMFAFFNNTPEVGYEGDISVSKPAKAPRLEITTADLDGVLSFIRQLEKDTMMVSVMDELDTVRKTYVLNRGQYDAPTDEVRPEPLSEVMGFDTTAYPRNRLGLAKWTVDKNNPLTARVFVNQVWQMIFGQGIVKTAGDFGMQGDLPSHPELLDWLAVDFMENDWDIKYLVKQIVTSATYMQSSSVSKEKLAIDPDNIYLSHGPRFRLPAEFVKDLILASSGLLVNKIGGPSVKAYQPDGLWEAATSGRGVLATYQQDHGEDLYRRGMYTFIKLTLPPPSLMIFDGSNRDQCEVKRPQTNTPLQALVMMNDPTMLEASRVLAEKLVEEQSGSEDKITKAFRLIVCRVPKESEKDLLISYFSEQLGIYKSQAIDPSEVLDVGEYLHLEVEKSAAAALANVIQLIYNMEESITKT